MMALTRLVVAGMVFVMAMGVPIAWAKEMSIPKGLRVPLSFTAPIQGRNISSSQKTPVVVAEDVTIHYQVDQTRPPETIVLFKKGTPGFANVFYQKPGALGKPAYLAVFNAAVKDVQGHEWLLKTSTTAQGTPSKAAAWGTSLSTMSLFTLPLLPVFASMRGSDVGLKPQDVIDAYTLDDIRLFIDEDKLWAHRLAAQEVTEILPPGAVAPTGRQYFEDFSTQLWSALKLPSDYTGALPIIVYRVLENGTLGRTNLVKSSGDPNLDHQVMEALYTTLAEWPMPPDQRHKTHYLVVSQLIQDPYRVQEFQRQSPAFKQWTEASTALTQRNTLPPSLRSQLRNDEYALAEILMDKQGKVLFCDIKESSQNPAVNDVVVKSIVASSPLPPLPPDYPSEAILFQTMLSYAAFRH